MNTLVIPNADFSANSLKMKAVTTDGHPYRIRVNTDQSYHGGTGDEFWGGTPMDIDGDFVIPRSAMGDYCTGMFAKIDTQSSSVSTIKELDLSLLNTSGIKSFNFMFWKCTNLGPNLDLSMFDVSSAIPVAGENGLFQSMFEDCLALRTLDLSNWNIPSAYSCDEYMFFSIESTLQKIIVNNCSNETKSKILAVLTPSEPSWHESIDEFGNVVLIQ